MFTIIYVPIGMWITPLTWHDHFSQVRVIYMKEV